MTGYLDVGLLPSNMGKENQYVAPQKSRTPEEIQSELKVVRQNIKNLKVEVEGHKDTLNALVDLRDKLVVVEDKKKIVDEKIKAETTTNSNLKNEKTVLLNKMAVEKLMNAFLDKNEKPKKLSADEAKIEHSKYLTSKVSNEKTKELKLLTIVVNSVDRTYTATSTQFFVNFSKDHLERKSLNLTGFVFEKDIEDFKPLITWLKDPKCPLNNLEVAKSLTEDKKALLREVKVLKGDGFTLVGADKI